MPLNPENPIAVVVLHYNKLRLTESCMRSILDAGYSPSHVYGFDNGSQPEVYSQLRDAFPRCCHRRIEVNLGYSGGFNRALEWVFSEGYDSAFFCTNDTRVTAGAAETCARMAGQTGAGLVAPLITYASDTTVIDSIGAYFEASTGLLHHYHAHGLPALLDPATDYIPGTALWINRDTFSMLGGTDETFHMYWEDVDLCFRAHRRGIALARCYDAVVRHGGGQTCRKKPLYTTYYFQRNRIRFCRRYLEGDCRDHTLEVIRRELQAVQADKEAKGDTPRTQYLTSLLNEEF
ncbi:MAG: glycosyltransferase family 2 protein [Candidatus Omnitrophota bacterium]